MPASFIKDHLLNSAGVKTKAAEDCSEDAHKAAVLIADSLKGGGKLMLCGNGGSAGDAQHIAAEFVATLNKTNPREGLRAMALTTDSSLLTAYSNDFGFEGVFARQVETFGDEGDVLIGLTTSGNSPNVIKAMEAAGHLGVKTVAMTGAGGGGIGQYADIIIAVPSQETSLIQEVHIALGHAITASVEKLLGY